MYNNLKLIREKRGLTQFEIATKANITVRNYQRIEKGNQDPRVTTAILIAKVLKTTVEKLFPISGTTETGKEGNQKNIFT